MASKPFEHLEIINRSIRELYRVLKPEGIARFVDEFALGDAEDVWRQPIVGTSQLVRRIAKHFRLNAVAVIVDFNDKLDAPGQVRLTNEDHFFVEIRRNIRFPKPLAALLVHEVSHIFLHRHGIRFPVTFENEVLTDTTTAFLGFGATMLNAATESVSYHTQKWGNGTITRTRTDFFGYITLDEFGYILAKREALLKRNCAVGVDEKAPLSAFQRGRELVLGERTKRPFVARPVHQRALRSIMGRKKQPPIPGQYLEFMCPNCAQILRVPEAHREMKVRCKVCDSRFTCYS